METEKKTSWLSRLWSGEIPLVKAFWLYGVVVFAAADGIVDALDSVTNPPWLNVAPTLMTVVCALDFAYAGVWCVGTWRSSTNYHGWAGWKYLACASVISQAVKGVVLFSLITRAFLESK
jgi:hypothetical protein